MKKVITVLAVVLVLAGAAAGYWFTRPIYRAQKAMEEKNLVKVSEYYSKLNRLSDITKKQWELAAKKWEGTEKVVFYEETKEILCRTACEWAGVPVQESEIKNLTTY